MPRSPGPPTECPNCKRVFTPKRRFTPPQRFCGHRCAIDFHREAITAGANQPEVIERRSTARRGTGKRAKYLKRDYRGEHRVVMEGKLGRALRSDEIVHHRDENGRNNAPSNLEAMTRAEHARLHHLGSKRAPRSVCKHGHPLVEGNVGKNRRCLTCERAYQAEWHRQKRRERGLQRPGPRPGSPGALRISAARRRHIQNQHRESP